MSDPHRLSASVRRGSRPAGQVLGGGADTDDLAAVVDTEWHGGDGAEPVDRGEPPLAPQEPGGRRGGQAARADADDLAAVVDVEGDGDLGDGRLEGGDPVSR